MTTRATDDGAALGIVLAALVLSSTISLALVDHVRVTTRDLDDRREWVERMDALDAAVRAARVVGTCDTSRWWMGEVAVEVICTGSADAAAYEGRIVELDGPPTP